MLQETSPLTSPSLDQLLVEGMGFLTDQLGPSPILEAQLLPRT